MAFLKYLLITLATSSLVATKDNAKPITGTPTVALDAAALATSYPAVIEPRQDAATVLQIHQTISLYAVLIDGKQFDKLDMVFHENVWANYSALIGAFHPLSVLQAGLQRSVAQVTTQHSLATQLVDIAADGTTARSATYFTASHFGIGDFYGQALWGWGTYEDNWVKELTTGRWKIIERTIIYQGPLIGNISIFGDITGEASAQNNNFSISMSSPLM